MARAHRRRLAHINPGPPISSHGLCRSFDKLKGMSNDEGQPARWRARAPSGPENRTFAVTAGQAEASAKAAPLSLTTTGQVSALKRQPSG